MLAVNTNGHVADSALFALPPEHIQVQPQPGQNALPGRVTDCMYRGEYIEYQVELKGMTARAHVPCPRRSSPMERKCLLFSRRSIFPGDRPIIFTEPKQQA